MELLVSLGASVSVGSLVDGAISLFLVLFGGTMSGLTLGLMSLDLVEMEVLQRSGTPTEQKQAAAIFPVVKKQHQLLVTLLLCNAVAMEALPIFLDNIFHPVVAIILSVTFVLVFGEIIPQALCSRYGLAIGANLVWLVRILMIICFPVSYPLAKLLDLILGHNDAGLFRRAQLKALVSIHGKDEGKGGELTHDETTIISGALDLTLKTAKEAMTPIESTFSLDVDAKLDWEALGRILATGHSRVPVYSGNPKNIIGLLLVKSLLTVRAEAETPVSAVSIRRIPRVPADMPLYDILNEFQKGQSHMAAVVRQIVNPKPAATNSVSRLADESTDTVSADNKTKEIKVWVDMPNDGCDVGKGDDEQSQQTTVKQRATEVSDDLEEGEVIGIITLEDVIEELLQEEIVDETDEYVDVHKRIRVAAAAAGVGSEQPARSSSAARLLSISRNARHAQSQKSVKDSSSKPDKSVKRSSSLKQPLLDKR
ncbi:hypothetical protein L7F22_027463 [Adiantum nelumboides]|nr:hypothetical protein [Adiantum nelumboides]